MKIAIFGAGGRIGSCIVKEALNRGHEVSALTPHPEKYTFEAPHLHVAKSNLFDSQDVESGVFDHDAVVCAYNYKPGVTEPSTIAEIAIPLLNGMKQAGVKRLLVVGGAGSLFVKPGLQLVDTPDFNPAYKPSALAHRDALNVYKKEQGIDWTYLSPAGEIAPGERTGKFRRGKDDLLVDANGRSFISMEDYAVAVLDELETPMHVRERFTVAY